MVFHWRLSDAERSKSPRMLAKGSGSSAARINRAQINRNQPRRQQQECDHEQHLTAREGRVSAKRFARSSSRNPSTRLHPPRAAVFVCPVASPSDPF